MMDYSQKEERLNVISHALGLILSVIGLVFLLIHAYSDGNIWHITSFTVFGVSLVVLYAASTFYHYTKETKLRKRLKILDHAAIYLLIAGTYTPFTLLVLKGEIAWIVSISTWSIAVVGIVLKLFFTGKYKLISTSIYVFMGCFILFFIDSLAENFSPEGMNWLSVGGVSYIIGAIFYSIKKIKYNHALFHVFVLIGSFCHYVSIFFYVLPF